MLAKIKHNPILLFGIISLLYLFIILPLLGIGPVGGSSEAREGQVTWKILTASSWQERVLPHRNGLVPSKPPLYHWLSAVVAKAHGSADEFAIRAVSAGSAAMLLFVSMLLAFRLCQKQNPRVALEVALLSALVLATTYGFARMAREARVDMLFSLFVVAAVCPILSEIEFGKSLKKDSYDKAFFLFFLFSGLACLAKGPLGLVLPASMIFFCLTYAHGLADASKLCFKPRVAWVVFLDLALAWYALALMLGGQAFLDRQLIFENVARFRGGDFVNSKPWWFYFNSLLHSALPYCLILVLLIFKSRHRLNQNRYQNLALICFLVGFVFFSASSGKRHSYLLPLFPALSIYVAWGMNEFFTSFSQFTKASLRKLVWNMEGLVPFIALTLMVALEIATQPWNLNQPILRASQNFLSAHFVWLQTCMLVLLLVSTLVQRFFYRTKLSLSVNCGVAVGLGYLLIFLGMGVKADLKQFKVFATQINSQLESAADLYVVKAPREEFFDPIFYYLKREVKLQSTKNPNLPENSLVLARLSWLESSTYNDRAEILSKFKSVPEVQAGTDRDTLVLFRAHLNSSKQS